MSDDIAQVELLFPSGKDITLKGKNITIKPYGFGKYPKILKLLKDLKLDEKSMPNSPEEMMAKAKSMDIMTLIAENSDAVVDLCALAINQPKTYFDDVMPDEAVELVAAVVEVNADFFVARLQPRLLKVLSKLTESVGGLLSRAS